MIVLLTRCNGNECPLGQTHMTAIWPTGPTPREGATIFIILERMWESIAICDTVAYSYVGIYMRQASTYRAVTYLKQVPSSFLLFPLHTDGGREKILHHASSCFLSIELLLRSIQFEIWREKKDYRTFLFFLSQTVYLLSTYHKQLFLRGSNSSVSDLQPGIQISSPPGPPNIPTKGLYKTKMHTTSPFAHPGPDKKKSNGHQSDPLEWDGSSRRPG